MYSAMYMKGPTKLLILDPCPFGLPEILTVASSTLCPPQSHAEALPPNSLQLQAPSNPGAAKTRGRVYLGLT